MNKNYSVIQWQESSSKRTILIILPFEYLIMNIYFDFMEWLQWVWWESRITKELEHFEAWEEIPTQILG